jgi:hypothetical protein
VMSRGYQPHIYRGRRGGAHFSKALWDWILGPRRPTGHGYSGQGVLLVPEGSCLRLYQHGQRRNRGGAARSAVSRVPNAIRRSFFTSLCLPHWVALSVRVRRASVRLTACHGLDSRTPAFDDSLLQYRRGPTSSHPINGKRNHGMFDSHSLHKPTSNCLFQTCASTNYRATREGAARQPCRARLHVDIT